MNIEFSVAEAYLSGMSPFTLIALQFSPMLILAGILFYLGNERRKASNALVAQIRARYPKWIIEFSANGSTVRHQVNSREEHEALMARLQNPD